MIDICGKYKECSKQQFCINSNLKDSCTYNLKLQQGHNFYNETVKNRYCLRIGRRQFYIGIRSNHGTYSRDLRKDDIEVVKNAIANIEAICLVDQLDFKYCINDNTSDNNRACCQVIWTIGNRKYNIKNFNVRAVVEDTAFKLRNYLNSKGFNASVEYVGRKTSNSHRAFIDFAGDTVHKQEKPKKNSRQELEEVVAKLKARGSAKTKEDDRQVSMFDLMVV